MADVRVITNEARRGCGYRKSGGLYLMAGAPSAPCGMLPIELTVCPCCGQGIKPARGWTWVNGRRIVADHVDRRAKQGKPDCDFNLEDGAGNGNRCHDHFCPMQQADELVGLLWVGGAYYKTAEHFMGEARDLGISRRITAVPNKFELGKTWVWLAHRQAVQDYDKAKKEIVYRPGVFTAFKPERIEYCVKGTETEEELDRMEKRGLTLVRLRRGMFDDPEPKT